jgi:hypothetical protein
MYCDGDEPTPLSIPVFQAWYQEAAWNCSSQICVPLKLGSIESDDLIDGLAQLLWNHRHLAKSRE